MREFHKSVGGLSTLIAAGGGISAAIDPALGALTTAGAGVLLAQLLAGGLIYRTGPAAAATDTTDTAANIEASFGSGLDIGDTRLIAYSNQTGQVITIAGGTGVTLSSAKATIIANGFGFLLLKKTGAGANAAYNLYVL